MKFLYLILTTIICLVQCDQERNNLENSENNEYLISDVNDIGNEEIFSNNRYSVRNSTDNRKPAFKNCAGYNPIVKEEQPSNTFVINVIAEDPDGDDIEYSIIGSASERPKFLIDSKTGVITTFHTFDRDEPIREKEVGYPYQK